MEVAIICCILKKPLSGGWELCSCPTGTRYAYVCDSCSVTAPGVNLTLTTYGVNEQVVSSSIKRSKKEIRRLCGLELLEKKGGRERERERERELRGSK